ncbi:MAG: hypothetical protein PUB00_08765, partial [Clostridiales bacterium]|nr:hypothetical protein [Clostridiales bacterium]
NSRTLLLASIAFSDGFSRRYKERIVFVGTAPVFKDRLQQKEKAISIWTVNNDLRIEFKFTYKKRETGFYVLRIIAFSLMQVYAF